MFALLAASCKFTIILINFREKCEKLTENLFITVTSALYPPARGYDINEIPPRCQKICPPMGPCFVKCNVGR